MRKPQQFIRNLCMIAPLLCLTSCEKKEPPPPPLDPATVVALQEEMFEPDQEGPKGLAEVRQLAADYVKAKVLNSEVRGISLHPAKEGEKEFRADVDCAINGQSETVIIPLVIQRFFPQRGDPYWRISLLHDAGDQTLDQVSDNAKLKRLNDLTQDPVKNDPLGLFNPSEKRTVKKP